VADVIAAARAGDESAFAELVARHERELRVHCYRMLGSFDEAEDLVQETLLRAWKNLGGFEGRSSLRAWLYRIATNACLDALDGRARRVLPQDLAGPSRPAAARPARTDIAWLQPFPDRLIEPVEPADAQPDAVAVSRETIELAFLAAIQHLPPRQRAALILRDVLGWPARETAALLDSSVAAVNSAVQRARATLKEHLPERRLDWAPSADPTGPERAVLRRYMDAMERADLAGVAALLADEVRTAMPPWPMWFQGRATVEELLRGDHEDCYEDWRYVPVGANGQLAYATYGMRDGRFEPASINVLGVRDGLICSGTAFVLPALFPSFGVQGCR
jgi:RNA polymerase sigma-70 factor (ECF subfamily)